MEAGAATVHLHTRDPETGKPVHRVELFKETIHLIREECDVIMNTTTGAAPEVPLDERKGIIPVLSADPMVKPEMASLNCSSLNVGFLNRKKGEVILNDVQMNPWESLLSFADTMKHCSVVAELEIYDAAMINNAVVLRSLDALEEPLHSQFVFDVLRGMQPTINYLNIPQGFNPPRCRVVDVCRWSERLYPRPHSNSSGWKCESRF